MDIKQILLGQMAMWQSEFALIFNQRNDKSIFSHCDIRRQDLFLLIGCPLAELVSDIKREFFQVARRVEEMSSSAVITAPGGYRTEIPLWMAVRPNRRIFQPNFNVNKTYYFPKKGSKFDVNKTYYFAKMASKLLDLRRCQIRDVGA